MTSRSFLSLLLAGAAAAALLAACGAGSTSEPTNAGFVRLVNATTEFATLDLYDGSSGIGAATSNGASAYVDREPTTHDFILRSGGTAVAQTLTVGVERQQRYTIVAYSGGGAVNTAYFTDNEAAPRSGNAKLRVFNTASADAGSMDVYLLGTACSGLPGSLVAPVASAVVGLQPGYVQVGAASYHVCVTAQGDKAALRLDIPAAQLADQQITTLILTGGAGGVLLNGLLLNQQAAVAAAPNTSARVRLVADTTSGLSVTATAGGVPLGSALSAPAVGRYTLVGTGALNLAVTIDGTATAPLADRPAQGGKDYTLLLSGDPAAPVARLIDDDNRISTSIGSPVKLRVLNGLNGAAAGASLTLNGSLVGQTAAFGTANESSVVASSSSPAALAAKIGNTDIPPGVDSALVAYRVYTVFLLGPATAPQPWVVTLDR